MRCAHAAKASAQQADLGCFGPVLLAAGKYKVSSNCAFTWPKGQHGLCGDPAGEKGCTESTHEAPICLTAESCNFPYLWQTALHSLALISRRLVACKDRQLTHCCTALYITIHWTAAVYAVSQQCRFALFFSSSKVGVVELCDYPLWRCCHAGQARWMQPTSPKTYKAGDTLKLQVCWPDACWTCVLKRSAHTLPFICCLFAKSVLGEPTCRSRVPFKACTAI